MVAVKHRVGRLMACLVVAAVTSTALPQAAYATATSESHDSGGKSIVDTVKGWFTDSGGKPHIKPPSHSSLGVADRQKLPKGKKTPKAHRVRELKSRRTPSARFWQLSDGRVQAELSAQPTAYRDAKSTSWKSIDTAVHASKTKGFSFANTTNDGQSWFGSDTSRLVRFKAPDGRSVTLGLDGAGKHLTPTVKGSTVTYQDRAHGADISYGVGRGRVKENITLAHRPSGPLKFTFTLHTAGLVPKARKDGSIALFGELPNTPVMVIPAPFMTDAKKNSTVFGKTYTSKVSQKLTRDRKSKAWKITVAPDAKWLAAKARRYPVVIDPTITIAPSPTDSQDAMVLSDQASTNFNSSWKLAVGRTSTGTARSLIKFPLSEIPSGTKISSARLEMYYDQTHTTNANDVTIGAYRATGAWDESTATWSNTSGLVGEQSGTSVQVDDGDAGTTAATGTWPASTSTLTQYAIGGDYHYNKDSVAGDTYTWQPKLPESDSYRVDVHYVPASDRATNAPFTVTGSTGATTYTVDESAGSGGVWTSLNGGNKIAFDQGTAGKVVLGDGPASTSTAVIADAVRWVNPATIVKHTGEYNLWHKFPVTDTVQKWLDGTDANYGFVLKGTDESSTGPLGGPRYEAGDGSYGGETSTIPRLTVTYGAVGTALDSPTVIHSTGPELHWPAYKNTSGDPGLDISQYELYRSTQQAFNPSPATLVAPIGATATAYTDTTATPTPDSSTAEIGRSYYYQIAVRTKNGQLLGSPTRIVGVPKAGRTMRLLQGTTAVKDTTLSSGQPTTNEDAIQSYGIGQKWLEVGNNSTTYGKARAALHFDTSAIPSSATVLESRLFMWGAETTYSSSGAIYELHGLNKNFGETTATWNNSDTGTAWSTPGGDYSATVSDTVGSVHDVGRHWWDATSLTQGWITSPTTNHGALVKLSDESATGAQERTLFLSSEASDPQLGPLLRVIYVDSTTTDTYYAPTTPQRMTPNSTYTVDFTVTNTTNSAWASGERELSYTWKLPDGTDVTTGGNQLNTAIPALNPGESATIQAQVATPINSDSGSKRTDYVLGWDVKKVSDGTWLSATNPTIAPLKQNVAVEDPTSNTLGLEKFYSYTGTGTGAGSSVMNNLASGNSVWTYNAFSNPGRGLGTFGRFSYNSLDTSDTVSGAGWSMQLAGPVRLGAPLQFHPKPNPTEIRLTDGDGTTHVFTWDSTNSVWKAPAGVHYQLTEKANLSCTPDKDPVPDAWTMLRPDGTRFYFGCDGYLTSIVDKNGNTQTYTYAERKSNNKPTKFLQYITDPAGRQSVKVDYYRKGDASYDYIDSTGAKVTGSNLTNSKIYDHVKSMTDISGRKISFYYTTKGLLGQFTDGDGSSQPKTFKFTYDSTQGNKNVKLVDVADPRGHSTKLAYYAPQTGDDPTYHWWTKTITDRLSDTTGFAYAADTANTKFTDTTITDAKSHQTSYVLDDFARPVQTTDAKSETTKLSWDADNNVTYLEENNGAKSAFCYDPKTGYPLREWDAETTKSWTSFNPTDYCNAGSYPADATALTYQTRADGYSADLYTKTSPEGHVWQFGYDSFGNLTSVTDPDGTATTTTGDYTTTYAYNSYGELTKATDADQHSTSYSSFEANGYPQTETDALGNVTSTSYDVRGEVLSVKDPLGKTVTQTYDTYGRPLESKTPKDQANGVYITTPAPVYDANDNVTQSTAPNGAVTTAAFDAADQLKQVTSPKDQSTDPDRITTYTYDKVGNELTVTSPKGNLSGATAGSYTTTYAYDALNRPVSVTDAAGNVTSTTYDNAGNTAEVVDPLKNNTTDTTDFTSKYTYDLDHRATVVTDAAGHTKKTGYDKDGRHTSSTDEDGNATLYTYDERGQLTEVQVPHDNPSGTITYDTTKYAYDQVGNQTKVYSPRAVAANSTTAFTAETQYDELNRVKAQLSAYDPNDATYNKPSETDYSYDADSRLTKVSAPPSAGQSMRSDTSYTYWDDGQTRTSKDPWDITTAYDHDELGNQTSRTITSAGGSSSRTMSWTYYPDGMIHTRTDNGVPVGLQVDLADNSDVQSTSATGSWPTATTGTDHQGYDYATHAAGTGTDTFTWNLTIPQDGTYQVYVKYPQVTGAATTAAYTVDYHGGAASKQVDQTKNTGTWVSLGSYAFTAADTTQDITLAQNSGGTVSADAVKVVRDNSADTDNEKTAFTYSYDANGNLTDLADATPGARYDDYAATFNGINQLSKLDVKKSGTAVHTTSFNYDADGNTLNRTHDAAVASFTYDTRNLLSQVTNKTSSTDPSPKVTQFTYTPGGQVATETKGNGNVVTSGYFLDGALKHQIEKKSDATTTVAEHTYTYDPDGNTSQDISKVQDADNHANYDNRTLDYAYTPRDQVATVTKTGGGSNESYAYDDNGNTVSQTVNGQTTTSVYDRNRLATTTVAGVASGYHYDPFGRLDTVTTAGSVIERYTYDGFDHIASQQKKNGTSFDKTDFTYDPFDRTVSQTVNSGTTNAMTTVFDYLAMSGAVTSETVNGTVDKTYQYSPWGERLSQVKTKSDGTKESTYYTYDAHSNVQAVTDAGGDTKSTYGYTAYGADDTSQDTGVDKPGSTTSDPSDPYNAYRFNADRINGSTGTYNMGFRNYDPGLNRFLSRDMYNGALSDMGLASDPLTGNRYAFGGGNPISNIELDGHGWLSDLGHTALDVAGMVPVVGSVADVANAAWYAADGDYLDAGVSLAGAIPVIGDAALGAREAIKGAKYAAEGAEALKAGAHAAEDVKAAVHGGEDVADTAKAADHSTADAKAAEAAEKAAAARKAAQEEEKQAAANEAKSEATAENEAEKVASGTTCSFSPDTKVLTGNGSTKRIDKIQVGDKVESADPKTGKLKGSRTVQHVWINHDHDLVDVTIRTKDGHTTTLHTTANHPFWDNTSHKWVPAGKLHHGDTLNTASGQHAHVVAIHATPGAAYRWNLTIDELHTYYVVADGVSTLVHNTCDGYDPEFPNIKLGNYRGRFNAWLNKNGFKRLPKDWDAHHAIPQEYRDHPEFQDFDFDAPSNMRGVPGSRMGSRGANVHQEITNQWKWFGDMNPSATRAEIEDFAQQIDRGYGAYFWGEAK
ncbi:golvesin C-terminal-like domain-containing protein [Streptomyces beihaiensis]|uniref:DNRLRE domain-containing protein n=1 Tax=Streptomyces beihaiensis TaxID=2984495 RepID=A0ABT3U584_9ACTN|nr:DNRLRE domain-containing protein [Streptomyces beihaiensis]MCX3064245.1 DNRLRE domain-containing protein [Streptomyces beihaiensis]